MPEFSMDKYHTPVLLQPACTYLNILPGSKYLDATLGGGGHTRKILNRGGHVLGLDQDIDSIKHCQHSEVLLPALTSGDFLISNSNFIHLAELVKTYQWQPLLGILFDLGVSSHQIYSPERGFSFQQEGPLDMRMDLTLPHTAATLVNSLPRRDLAAILRDFGDVEPNFYLADKIILARPITTTTQLSRIVGHPQLNRQVFQALRIAINDELGSLRQALPQAIKVLAPGGRIVVISFHSLEDRIVKNQFSTWEDQGLGKILTPQPVTPDETETKANPRSKSAKLYAFQKNI